MSFQDFGRKSSSRPTPSLSTSVPTPATATHSSSQSNPLANISDTLLQYQRNVGILEKISHSLVTSTKNCPELDAQYRAQMDVLGQLEDKIRRLIDEQLIHSSPQHQSTVTKLQRDFDRVQNRVRAMQSAVEKWKKQQHVKAASIAPTTTANTLTVEEQQYQLQLQLQQDRLAEEIMREREEEIRNINRGMHQVNEIYKDLAHIVGAQQEQIDTIETQMEDAKVNAESGLKQVEKANEKYGNQCVIS